MSITFSTTQRDICKWLVFFNQLSKNPKIYLVYYHKRGGKSSNSSQSKSWNQSTAGIFIFKKTY